MTMRAYLVIGLVLCALAGQAEAFTSKGKSTLSVSASGVIESTTFDASAIVAQGTADTPATLGFGSGGNDFRDSGEAIKVTVSTNAANNRIIVYTDNLSTGAVPKAQLDTSTGIDGGGLVGVTDQTKTVPLFWAVEDTNVDHAFTSGTVGDDEIFVTDRAHVASFTTSGSTLDNQAMVRCRDGVAVANTPNNGRYPQFFGNPGLNEDLCDVFPNGNVVSQELSKNIAVTAFGFVGTSGLAPNLLTPSPADTIPVTSPYYLPIAADFRTAVPQDYATSTLTVEMVTQ